MKPLRISLGVGGLWLWFLGAGCTTYKLEPAPRAALFSDQDSQPIMAAVSVPATEGSGSLLEDQVALELIHRLQSAGLFEQVHYAARRGESGIATVELDRRKKKKPVSLAGQLTKVFLVALTLGATAPFTTFKEEWTMDWTLTVSRGSHVVKTYSASTTLLLKHRGLPSEPGLAWQSAREQLWGQLLGQMAADRASLASALATRNKQPESEVLP